MDVAVQRTEGGSDPPPLSSLLSPAPEEDVLHLFDFYWFHHQILSSPPPPLPPPPPDPLHTSPIQPTTRTPLFLRRHRRSLSDESVHASAAVPSAFLAIRPPKLCTILSGKEAPKEDLFAGAEPVAPAAGASETKSYGRWRQRGGRRRRKNKEKSKSLTDLEFEELKGLVDLGFTFSDAETDPRLLEIVPALQRLGLGRNRASEEEAPPAAPVDATVSRPYLSEAWEVAEAKPEERLLKNLIPAGVGGADLKGQLRCWAHAVASTVR
ncbi:hypothetical protein OPV22_020385 [Ensete ventricosum]|uniref:DUF1685 domain-containing protein n=1 Tax=Ensete ventricosum TaxID=4639 RepID=A0AAV8QIQ8_ENSVE|nr:hypothetical protein OPV22_020385 [Ensete ventricosum]RWW23882.1 hypothetical protein GW17_00011849 [Ensete ventricosum]RWW66554.1 hypothetical protein BHE74_00026070 [Ensete ventricosum]RZR92034.1 hypothetical protein BHM03_00020257 [Ensete ventricosum]